MPWLWDKAGERVGSGDGNGAQRLSRMVIKKSPSCIYSTEQAIGVRRIQVTQATLKSSDSRECTGCTDRKEVEDENEECVDRGPQLCGRIYARSRCKAYAFDEIIIVQ